MKYTFHEHKVPIIGFSLVAIAIIAIGAYSYQRKNTLSTRIDGLSANIYTLAVNLASTTKELQTTIDETHSSLSTALSNVLNDEQKNVGAIQQQLGGFQNQVGSLSGSLNTLQKLAQTDPELLKKYSKAFFLNENYVPARLSEIPQAYQYSNKKQLLLHTDVLPRIENMINTASSTGIKLYIFSAYRSFAEQQSLKSLYNVVYGAGTANSFSADQGYSEHQLGTAVDFTTKKMNGALDGFEKTPEYTWLLSNAYEYGFVISYPLGNKYYKFEPWHWRFVGVALATYLHDNNMYFYDMDQRSIDNYLADIFD